MIATSHVNPDGSGLSCGMNMQGLIPLAGLALGLGENPHLLVLAAQRPGTPWAAQYSSIMSQDVITTSMPVHVDLPILRPEK